MAAAGAEGLPRTLIIIPAFNEEEALPGVLRSLAQSIPDFDILVVDDGSHDATHRVAEAAGVWVARLPFNVGIGGALRTGFQHAVRAGYQRAAQFDADGQHDASALATLFNELDRGADLVIGSRFATSETEYRPGRIRGGAMGVLRLFLRVLAGRAFTDTSSGFRAFSGPMLEFFARNYPHEYLESPEALLLACYAGYRVVEVPVRMNQRAGGAPSQRSARLTYHYVRLFLALSSMASRKGRAAGRNA